MGIGVDAEGTTELDPAAQPTPLEIEPPGIAIDLDCDTMLSAGAQHALDVQVIAQAAEQLPAVAPHVSGVDPETIASLPPVAARLDVPVASGAGRAAPFVPPEASWTR